MAQKYRAKVNIPPGVLAGQIVVLNEPPIAEYKDKLEPYNGDAEEGDFAENDGQRTEAGSDIEFGAKQGIVNPDRNELKARATELGINFASNAPTERLIELIAEAEAKRSDGGAGSAGSEE